MCVNDSAMRKLNYISSRATSRNCCFSIVCLKMYKTLFNYDTALFADSVEVIPNSYDGLPGSSC